MRKIGKFEAENKELNKECNELNQKSKIIVQEINQIQENIISKKSSLQ